MVADQILAIMRAYFETKQPPTPPEALADFPHQSPKGLLVESLDVVDFIVYLEEELGREIDVNTLGEALINKDFGELSEEVSRILAEG